MLDDFSELGIEMVALSPDTLAESRRTQNRGKLRFPVLSDPNLEIIDRFGLRHEKAIGAPRDGKLIRPLAIPTTVLIDAEGIVRWVDQAEDYRVRSNPDRVLQAVRASL